MKTKKAKKRPTKKRPTRQRITVATQRITVATHKAIQADLTEAIRLLREVWRALPRSLHEDDAEMVSMATFRRISGAMGALLVRYGGP